MCVGPFGGRDGVKGDAPACTAVPRYGVMEICRPGREGRGQRGKGGKGGGHVNEAMRFWCRGQPNS